MYSLKRLVHCCIWTQTVKQLTFHVDDVKGESGLFMGTFLDVLELCKNLLASIGAFLLDTAVKIIGYTFMSTIKFNEGVNKGIWCASVPVP